MPPVAWHVYLVRCADGTLYCGAANRVGRRVRDHSAGRGARYTRGRGPVVLAYLSAPMSKSQALRREREVKALPKHRKERLVEGWNP